MAAGGPNPQSNLRTAPLQQHLVHLNGFPANIGTIVIASTSVPATNASTATAFQLIAGQAVHLQADSPVFVGCGLTAAAASTNALNKSKRLDAWEPYVAYLDDPGNPAGLATSNVPAGTLVYLAVALQSAGAGNLYVGNQR